MEKKNLIITLPELTLFLVGAFLFADGFFIHNIVYLYPEGIKSLDVYINHGYFGILLIAISCTGLKLELNIIRMKPVKIRVDGENILLKGFIELSKVSKYNVEDIVLFLQRSNVDSGYKGS